MFKGESGASVFVVGDVHGCFSLLQDLIWPLLGCGSEIIFVGDYCDRSPEPGGDLQVLELVRELQNHPDAYGLEAVTCLRGNHEQMLLDALKEEKPGRATKLWIMNGGNPEFLLVAREHQDWLESLPYTAIRGRYLFVHAGVRPGVRLEYQDKQDLLWIREPFLSRAHGLPYTVVHGHTFRSDAEIDWTPHRIGIDTGAFWSGKLSALQIAI